MIVIYTSPGCASCRKVKNYMKDNELKYIEKNIFKTLLNEREIKYLMSRTENGTEDIISKRSKIVQDNNFDLDCMTVDELCKFIVDNPSVLKRPIIIDDRNLQVGFDEEEIEIFKRIKAMAKCDKNCAHYKTCGLLREDKED